MKKITVIERICFSFINNCDYNINNLVLKYSVLNHNAEKNVTQFYASLFQLDSINKNEMM